MEELAVRNNVANKSETKQYIVIRIDNEFFGIDIMNVDSIVKIQQITRDHSLVEEMINLGEIDRRNARTHEKKNIITRAIGVDSEVVADFFEVEYSKGDIILMCSDGLSNMIEDEDMKMIINEGNDVSEIANKLIEVANNNGGKDNISVVLVEPD